MNAYGPIFAELYTYANRKKGLLLTMNSMPFVANKITHFNMFSTNHLQGGAGGLAAGLG